MRYKFYNGFGDRALMSVCDVNCARVRGCSSPNSGLVVSMHVRPHMEKHRHDRDHNTQLRIMNHLSNTARQTGMQVKQGSDHMHFRKY